MFDSEISIHISSVANPEYLYQYLLVTNHAQDAISAHTPTPSIIYATKLLRIGKPTWILGFLNLVYCCRNEQ